MSEITTIYFDEASNITDDMSKIETDMMKLKEIQEILERFLK